MIKGERRKLTAFGSSRTAKNDPDFQDVEVLAGKLAVAGWDGLVGGHQGMMAAFSQGMCKSGAHVTGVTLAVFPTPPNNTLSEEQRASDFFKRMQTLIEDADAYLVLPGGLGTLSEFSMTWDLLAIGILKPRPLVVYGACWKPLMAMIERQLTMSVDHGFACVHYCETHDEVMDVLAAL